MYIKLEKEQGKKFTFFTDAKASNTEKVVFANLSESIKVNDGFENDYWKAMFCGRALEKAKKLTDKTRILVIEMNIRNRYSKEHKKSYPQIIIFDFEVIQKQNSKQIQDDFQGIDYIREGENPFDEYSE